MSDRFQYVVVRYVPNVVREEGVNVGVLVRAVKEPAFDFKFLPRSSAVRKLWPSADQQIVRNFERELKIAIGSQPSLIGPDHPLVERFGYPSDSSFFDRARREFTGNLQLTEPRGYQAADIRMALRWAYSTFVNEPPGGARPINYQAIAPFRLRKRLWSAFERRDLVSPKLVRRQFVISGRHAPWTFDLAYRNGAINLITSVALNAPTLETNLGRALVFKGMIDDVAEKDDAHGIAVVQVSANEGLAPGAEQAASILDDSMIDVVDVGALDSLVDRVEAELGQDP